MRVLVCLCLSLFSIVTLASEVHTIAGDGTKGYSGDGGPAIAAQLNNPYAVKRGPDGFIYICDVDNHRIRRINKLGVISTYAGSGRRGYAGDSGSANEADLNQPYDVAWDQDENLFFVELGNNVVRRIDARTGSISTVAGNGAPGFSGDGGPSEESQLNQPHSLEFDAQNNLYVCDILNYRIRKIDLMSGRIETWSGNGTKSISEDGTTIGMSALYGPRAIAFDSDGNGWLVLREGNALLRLNKSNQQIQRIAGTGKSGFSGNGGPALAAQLAGPKSLAVDKERNVYLADTESHTIREVNARTGTIEVVVGNGAKGDGPDGTEPLKCQLARPHGVFVDTDGSILIGDSENHRVRRLIP